MRKTQAEQWKPYFQQKKSVNKDAFPAKERERKILVRQKLKDEDGCSYKKINLRKRLKKCFE